MATTAMDYEAAGGDRFEDDNARYDRQRSASPRGIHDDDGARGRSASAGANDTDLPPKDKGAKDRGDDSLNTGSNLFVTGIHPRLTEEDVSRMFEKYGEVEKAQIMRDPHTHESRGFGFFKMVTREHAMLVIENLHGEKCEDRTFSIEMARRSRPRTPTPGKYFGPPKRGGPPLGGGRDDRRRGFGRDRDGRDEGYRVRDYDRYDRGPRDHGYDRGFDRSYGGDRGYSDRGYGGDRGYDRRDREEPYGRGRGGDRDHRDDSYSGRGGGGGDRRGDRDRHGGRSERFYRDGPPGGYGDDAGPREPREPRESRESRESRGNYGGSNY